MRYVQKGLYINGKVEFGTGASFFSLASNEGEVGEVREMLKRQTPPPSGFPQPSSLLQGLSWEPLYSCK